jgi:phosphate transport system permease protein
VFNQKYVIIMKFEKNLKIRVAQSRLVFVMVCVLSAVTAIPLVAILGEVLLKGWHQLDWTFLTQSTPDPVKAMMAADAGQPVPGGIANGIVGTCLMLLMASALSIPVGIMCGICLSEYRKSKLAVVVSYLTDLLQGTPSIIIGIITYIWVVVPMKGYSAFAGSVSLFIMMLPLVIRSTEETMNVLPPALKEAGLALGGSYWRVMLQVMLPASLGSIFTGILLAISRVAGETAPLMFTALGGAAVSWNMSKPMAAVPLLIWNFFNDPNLQSLIWGASLFLLLFVLCLNLLSKRIAKKWKIY